MKQIFITLAIMTYAFTVQAQTDYSYCDKIAKDFLPQAFQVNKGKISPQTDLLTEEQKKGAKYTQQDGLYSLETRIKPNKVSFSVAEVELRLHNVKTENGLIRSYKYYYQKPDLNQEATSIIFTEKNNVCFPIITKEKMKDYRPLRSGSEYINPELCNKLQSFMKLMQKRQAQDNSIGADLENKSLVAGLEKILTEYKQEPRHEKYIVEQSQTLINNCSSYGLNKAMNDNRLFGNDFQKRNSLKGKSATN